MNYFDKYSNQKNLKLKNYYLCENPKYDLFLHDRIKYAHKHNHLLKPGGIIQSIQGDYVTLTFHNKTNIINMKYCIIFKKLRKLTKKDKMLYLLNGLDTQSIRLKQK